MFVDLPVAVRFVLLIGLGLCTVRASARSLHNGILLLLITSLIFAEYAVLIEGTSGLPNMTLERAVWPLLLLVFVWQWKQGKIHRHPPDVIETCMGILVVVIIGNMLAHGTHRSDEWGEGKLHFFAVLSGFFLPYMSYAIMRRAVLRPAHAHAFVTGVSGITLYLAVTGLGEAWQQPWLVFPKYILDPDLGIHAGYVRGPVLNATWNGIALVMGLPLLFWLCFGPRRHGRWLWCLGIAAVGAVLPYVFQHAVWAAAAAIGIAMVTWPQRGLPLLAAGVLIVSAGSFMMPQALEQQLEERLAEKETIAFRFRLLDVSYTLIGENLGTGVGFYRFDQELVERRYGQAYSSHNTPLTLFAELGLLGFVPYLAIFSLLLFESALTYWQQPGSRVLIGGLWALTAAYLIGAISVDVRAAFYPNVLFFALWGMVIGMVRRGPVVPPVARAPRGGQPPWLREREKRRVVPI